MKHLPNRQNLIPLFLTLFLALFHCHSSSAQTVGTQVVGESKTSSFKVMSFNLRYGSANDGENRWEKRTDLVKEVIASNAPDLLGTQETLPFQFEFIAANFPEYSGVGRSREPNNDNGEQCALFYRKSRFDKLAEGHFWLSENSDRPGSKSWDSSLPRMATWVRLWDRAEEKPIFFLNTHFDHRGEQARQKSALLIKEKCLQLADGAAIVISGDFNASATSVPHENLLSDDAAKLVDSFQVKNGTEEKRSGTFNGFQGKQDGPRIDWIVVSGPSFTIESSEIVKFQKNNRFPSDHFPVTTILQWK